MHNRSEIQRDMQRLHALAKQHMPDSHRIHKWLAKRIEVIASRPKENDEPPEFVNHREELAWYNARHKDDLWP